MGCSAVGRGGPRRQRKGARRGAARRGVGRPGGARARRSGRPIAAWQVQLSTRGRTLSNTKSSVFLRLRPMPSVHQKHRVVIICGGAVPIIVQGDARTVH